MIKWLVALKVDDGLAVEGLWEQVDWRDLYGGEGAFFDKAFEIARQGGRVAGDVHHSLRRHGGHGVHHAGGQPLPGRVNHHHVGPQALPLQPGGQITYLVGKDGGRDGHPLFFCVWQEFCYI